MLTRRAAPAPAPAFAPAPASAPVSAPTSAAQAVAMARAGLAWLAAADATTLTVTELAECLRGLERAQAVHTAARARVLAAFCSGGGYEDDGHGSAKTWLRWQTRVTDGAAAGAMGWMRRLGAHPAVRDALAAAQLSESWARQICVWSDLLPERYRRDADEILLGAAAGGAELADLDGLAGELRRRLAPPDRDGDGFDDRRLRLEATFGGAGRLEGDLTPGCAAALGAVLEALGRKAGPEDVRTKGQRAHDALQEACRRLVGSGCLPQRAGQPTQIVLHMGLDRLRDLPGAGVAEAAWPGPAAGPGDDCDASIVPVVTGHVDPGVLARLAAALLGGGPLQSGSAQSGSAQSGSAQSGSAQSGSAQSGSAQSGSARPGTAQSGSAQPGTAQPGTAQPGSAQPGSAQSGSAQPGAAGSGSDVVRSRRERAEAERQARAMRAARHIVIKAAADLLSGPGGLASYLRTRLAPDIAASVSLPLDVGAVTETIPVHLRRAVIARDRHCRWPGCRQPAAACQPHHIVPRSQGGSTCLTNMILLCSFHHLIAIHRWGWGIVLLPDGSVTVTSPDGYRTYRSHDPPAPAAA